ncbi:MAG: dienelactone hydrolase family protein [Sphingomonadaceae bacterium]|nr:dienelactone hydrolase family protein [Sphingomonadaceae bacterium]
MAMQSLEIAAADGCIDAELYLSGEAPRPAVLLFTDIRGIREAFRAHARRLAEAGHAVLMPNIFYRWTKPPVMTAGESMADPAVRDRLMGWKDALGPDEQARDFAALIAALDAQPGVARGPIAAVGYCMTGSFALRCAALHPDRVAAAASFHGGSLAEPCNPLSVHELVGAIRARVHVGHADEDATAPPDQIARLDRALADAHVDFTTEFYRGARHGFTIDGQAYDATASARHFARLTTLLAETLG